jgi:hypothetical protein
VKRISFASVKILRTQEKFAKTTTVTLIPIVCHIKYIRMVTEGNEGDISEPSVDTSQLIFSETVITLQPHPSHSESQGLTALWTSVVFVHDRS